MAGDTERQGQVQGCQGVCFREGPLCKFSIGKGTLGRKNWKDRWFVADEEGLKYYGRRPTKPREYAQDKEKGRVEWSAVTRIVPSIGQGDHPNVVNPERNFYFGIEFSDDRERSKRASFTLLLNAPSARERGEWVSSLHVAYKVVVSRDTSELLYEVTAEEELQEDDLDILDEMGTMSGIAGDTVSSATSQASGSPIHARGRTAASQHVARTSSPIPTTREPSATFHAGYSSTGSSPFSPADDLSSSFSQTRRRKGSRNTSAALGLIKTLVSKNKKRFVSESFNLDLVYITPQFIAMGFPAEGHEAYYRNKLEDVEQFMDLYHAGKYRIYNLCKERGYGRAALNGCWERYPFEDHNPPPLAMLPKILQSIRAFLSQDPANVAAVHCKAGKGRTGTVISSYLCAYHNATPAEALELFAKERTTDGKGVTIPSQLRYVGYAHRLMTMWKGQLVAPSLKLRSITLSNIRGGKREFSDTCSELYFSISRRGDSNHDATYGDSLAGCDSTVTSSPLHGTMCSSAPGSPNSSPSFGFRSIQGNAVQRQEHSNAIALARKRTADTTVSISSSFTGSVGNTSPLDDDAMKPIPIPDRSSAVSLAESNAAHEDTEWLLGDLDVMDGTPDDDRDATPAPSSAVLGKRLPQPLDPSVIGAPYIRPPTQRGACTPPSNKDTKDKFESVYDSRMSSSRRRIMSMKETSQDSANGSPSGSLDNVSFGVSSCTSASSPSERPGLLAATVANKEKESKEKEDALNDQESIEFPVSDCSLCGDFRVSFYAVSRVPLKSDQKLFHFWLNSAMLPANGTITLKKSELDGLHKDKQDIVLDSDFTATLTYLSAPDSSDISKMAKQETKKSPPAL